MRLFQPIFSNFEALPIRAHFPFSIDTNPGYGFAYVFQAFAAFYILVYVTAMENVCFDAINQIALHINILTIKYSKLGMHRQKYGSEISFQEAMKNQLDAFIMEHQDIIRYFLIKSK